MVRWGPSLPVVCYREAPQSPAPYLVAIDSTNYLALAEGHVSEVRSPFTKRLLYPFMAGALARRAHLALPVAFLALNMASLVLLAACLAGCLVKLGVNPWLAALCLLTPFPIESLVMAYLPDLFHAALLSVFFLLLLREREGWALAALLLAFVARESTLLLSLVLAWFAWRRGRKFLLYGTVCVLGMGWAVGSWFTRLGQPNIHHIPEVLYLGLKLPYNFIYNMFGVLFWTNLRADLGTPTVRWPLPHFLQIGADREIGFLFDWSRPIQAVMVWLTVFGCGPLLARRWCRRAGPRQQWPLAVQVAFAYGLLSFVISVALGAWVSRLAGYGWPLFWIALPYCLKEAGLKFSVTDGLFLALASFLVAWVPNLSGYWNLPRLYTLGLLAVPLLYGATYGWMRVVEAKTDAEPGARATASSSGGAEKCGG